MFESPRKSVDVLESTSKSQVEIQEMQPVFPMSSGDQDKTKKKKKQQRHAQEKGSVSFPETCIEESPKTVFKERTIGEEKSSSSSDNPIARGIFKIEKRSCDVVLTATRLIWTQIQPETPTGEPVPHKHQEHLELREVFAVKAKRRRSVGQQTGGTVLGITLFRCMTKGQKLEDQALHLHNLSADHCQVWFNHLKDILNGYLDRPKSLKVFVNPTSHRKEAYQIYRDDVAPLFRLADIKADVTVTERKGHALSVLKECRFDGYDGVVVVGGDGSVAEVAHGLLLRAQMDAGRDTDSIFTPVRAALPLGVIPAGSTDIVACSTQGIRHPITAAMHIIMGHRQAVDVCSFSSQGQLLRFGFSAIFGFGGRVLALAEKQRWMPPSQRRDFAFIKTLANLKPEHCEVAFLTQQPAHGVAEETECEELRDLGNGATEDDEAWQTIQGPFLNISIMAIPCVCSVAPRGLAPTTRLNNGSMALITVGNASKSEFLKHLKRHSSVNNQFSFTFVETHSVQAVKLRLPFWSSWGDDLSEDSSELDSKNRPIITSEGSHPWNIDGDLVELPSELLVRVHPQLITLFGMNIEEGEDSPMTCSCI
ncbi:hypothetical protein GJAV_G00204100 [Gymnothorax javanicus]|nr:hypothetical protein GJAV_G00204100 [Gymnothorax javanicus]